MGNSNNKNVNFGEDIERNRVYKDGDYGCSYILLDQKDRILFFRRQKFVLKELLNKFNCSCYLCKEPTDKILYQYDKNMCWDCQYKLIIDIHSNINHITCFNINKKGIIPINNPIYDYKFKI